MALAKGSVDSLTDLARLHRVHVVLVFIAFIGLSSIFIINCGIRTTGYGILMSYWYEGQSTTDKDNGKVVYTLTIGLDLNPWAGFK